MIRRDAEQREQRPAASVSSLPSLAAYVPAQLVTSLARFAAIAVFTRALSQEGYGRYSLVLTTVSLLGTLAVGWIAQGAIRFTPTLLDERAIRRFHRAMFYVAAVVLTALAATAAPLAWALLRGGADRGLALAGLALLVVSAFISLLLSFLRAKGRTGAYSALACGQVVGALVFGGIAACLYNGEASAVAVVVGGAISGALLVP
ncbi:hypothetical protein JW848_10300, partial [Candidatus Bipolaricaulota bacterium]|nr:hypothetical protein [Candidatus Bipolaricaulota bacterium]